MDFCVEHPTFAENAKPSFCRAAPQVAAGAAAEVHSSRAVFTPLAHAAVSKTFGAIGSEETEAEKAK